MDALIFFYYIGAFILPVGVGLFASQQVRKYAVLHAAYQTGQTFAWRVLSTRQKLQVGLLVVALFFIVELFWRMMIEFLIAYLQIRDILVNGSI